MQISSLSLIAFLFYSYIVLIFFIEGSMYYCYSESIKRRIIEELEKDGMGGGIEHIFHRFYPAPVYVFMGFVMLMFSIFFAIIIIIADFSSKLYFLYTIPIILLNMFLQYKFIHYLVRINKKIKNGERNTLMGFISAGIMFGNIPDKALWIFLVIVFVLHFAAILKIIF